MTAGAGAAGSTAGFPRLHVVTGDAEASRPDFADRVDGILAAGGGRVAVHLRLREATGRELHEHAVRTREAARRHGGWCVVNDRVDVALTARADAVQLGGASLPVTAARRVLPEAAAVGRSVHGIGAARRAAADGANYLVLGTIYRTPSHPDRPGAGPGLVREASGLGPPVVAIGGVTADRAPEVLRAGAEAVAARRAVWERDDPAAAAAELLEAFSSS